jgi:23S rRNA (guanine2445-N2)-methyltransferase / 23S rRNA (guanine2069-N7)-methyltransferase
MTDRLSFFATTPKGLEQLLAEELTSLGAATVTETRAGVAFTGPLETAYRACLWSRLASRILLPLATFGASSPEELYDGVRALDWSQQMAANGSLAVDCNLSQSKVTHSHYAALKVKDAVVDQFRDCCGERPGVDTERPDLRINLYLHRDEATISVDFSGSSLHRRGYREDGALAPLKENLAAAILLRCGWPQIAAEGGALVDPMCGSGTLPLEAALMAADCAPGLTRPYFGFLGWAGHDRVLWQRLLEEARKRRTAGLARLPQIVGYDADPRAIKAAWANAGRAGLQEQVHFERRELAALTGPPSRSAGGLLVVNPPYGERLGEVAELRHLYAGLGSRLREHFPDWKAAVFTGNPELGRAIGLRARRIHSLFNGALQCQLLHFDITPEWFSRAASATTEPPKAAPAVELSAGAEMVANRLRKNLRNLGRWARQNGVYCYRLYDADLPEYAVAIDLYEQWVHVQEYEAPKTIDPELAATRLQEVLAVLPGVLGLPAEAIFLKLRRRQKGSAQYGKFAAEGVFHEVREGQCRFLVNFTDYLDTGLFLDHRLTRGLLQSLAKGRRFLNLFGYTGSASVHAAMGGALSTTTVDMSKTYLGWARKNLALNGFTDQHHEFIQADCLEWLATEQRRFGLIFLDPPTFSNSKTMADTFDVQRDHVDLLTRTASLLTHDGVLIFSNNNRRFRMDLEALPELLIEEITRQTLPKDFERNPKIHNCWKIRRR